MLVLVASAVLGLSAQLASPTLTLDVPFLAQTDKLCGGASAAMIFRYWGNTHADARQFERLVDRRAGGIWDQALVDEVRRRGWQAVRLAGSMETLTVELRHRRPVMVLLQDRPNRFHFVVVTGLEQQTIVLHDPAWGPFRRMRIDKFIEAWKPTGFWSLMILPSNPLATSPSTSSSTNLIQPDSPSDVVGDRCDRLLAGAIADGHGDSGIDGLASIEAALNRVRAECPASPGPLRELAGVRFAQRRWAEAAALGEAAVELGDTDPYSWNVIASSRYMQDDMAGALSAWNRIGQPRVDLIRIEGLRRTRFPLITSAMDLPTNSLLTERAYRRAKRRLAELPGQTSSRISFKPADEGYATVNVAVAERRPLRRRPIAWTGPAARAAIDREISLAVPGATGQGEVWSASWRWWTGRPRVSFAFAAPRVGRVPGVFRVEGGWERETHATSSETHTFGRLVFGDWITPDVRYNMRMGLEAWDGVRRTILVGTGLERRLIGDRISLSADAATWMPVNGGERFNSVAVRGRFRSSARPSGWVYAGESGMTAVSGAAPLGLWPGAGEGRAREPLLRAHPLLEGGTITGPAFGRRLVHASAEVQRWFDAGWPVRVGAAMFADAASAYQRTDAASGKPLLVDGGVGLRVRLPGTDGTLRVDFGSGLRDGARALTMGWQF